MGGALLGAHPGDRRNLFWNTPGSALTCGRLDLSEVQPKQWTVCCEEGRAMAAPRTEAAHVMGCRLIR
jgi:hypothetical protein